jgi:NAD(P)H-dependent flavin oxidoreductase YrpB (nitropropane dioxygenase family)
LKITDRHSVLIPACADVCRQYKSPITGKEVLLVGAGGIGDGRGVAAALMLGAAGVWVGTRFVPSLESGATEAAKKSIVASDFNSSMITLIFTGRPCRVFATPYMLDWEANRKEEMKELLAKGVLPVEHDMDE